MKEPKRLLSHGATDFERQLLRAVSTERPSALLRSRMQRSLGLVGPLAWASNVKAMFGGVNSKVAVGAAVAGVVLVGGVAAYQLAPRRDPIDGRPLAAPAAADVTPAAPAAEMAAPAKAMAAERTLAPDLAGSPDPEARAGSAAPEAAEPGVTAAPASAAANVPAIADESDDGRLREEIALLDGIKAALHRGEHDQARRGLDTYRERFPDGILRREANVLRRRTEAK